MLPENYLEIILRLALALVLGGLIGIERSGTNHDAGMRTHILVCLGSTGVMIVSTLMNEQYGGDIGRLGAQVVSGIGFLGAGCILVNGNRIKGLTTAAGLWATACVGLSIGLGYYFVSVIMAALMLTATLLLHPLAARIESKSFRQDFTLRIHVANREEQLNDIMQYMYDQKKQILSAELDDSNILVLKVADQTESEINHMICSLVKIESVKMVERA